MLWHRAQIPLIVVFLLTLGAGCSDDTSDSSSQNCPVGEERNPLTGECERIAVPLDTGDASADSSTEDTGRDSSVPQDAGSDAAPADAGEEDARQDTSQCPDRDGDGAKDQACGGQDCDDDNPAIGPSAPELCDEHDNDCDGQLNQGLQCQFYAQSSDYLFEVDPFEKSATQLSTVPNLFDIDTHPDGTLYGITASALLEYDANADSWAVIGQLGVTGTPNGLAINNQGTAFMTASNDVYTVDLETGAAIHVGAMGGTYNSSGDCVVNKDNSLYMSSNHNFAGDALVIIDGTTGQAQDVGVMNFSEVYGLTAAWGRMFGMTGSGQLIEINSGTGQATLIHTFPGIMWYGAASTPQR